MEEYLKAQGAETNGELFMYNYIFCLTPCVPWGLEGKDFTEALRTAFVGWVSANLNSSKDGVVRNTPTELVPDLSRDDGIPDKHSEFSLPTGISSGECLWEFRAVSFIKSTLNGRLETRHVSPQLRTSLLPLSQHWYESGYILLRYITTNRNYSKI